jgi:ribonuclease P protein component
MGSRGPLPPPQEGAQAPHRAAALQAPEPLTGERYPRRGRLARGSELTACWETGRRRRTSLLDLAWRPNRTGHPRTGIIVPRFQSTAVARNRLRRRLREILRRGILQRLPAVDIVVRAKRPAYAAPFAVLRAELTDALAGIP